MTKIQYCSDLHLEFPENKYYLQNNPIHPKADILVLAGDIMLFSTMDKFDWFFNDLSNKFKQVYWIPGNHEYYRSNINHRTGYFKESIRKNIFLINNQTVDINNVRLIFSTLWTKLSDENQEHITQLLSDFRVINKDKEILSSVDYNKLHQENLSFIETSLKDSPKKNVVVTHHVPTFYNYPEKYKGDPLNEAFAVELRDLIKKFNPEYWIYGHHHSNINPFKIGETTLLTNQLGYVRMGEHFKFSSHAVIEI